MSKTIELMRRHAMHYARRLAELSDEYRSGRVLTAVSAIDLEWAQIDTAHHRVISKPGIDEDGALAYLMIAKGFVLPQMRSSEELVERAKAALRWAQTLDPGVHADSLITVGAAALERDDLTMADEFHTAGIEMVRSSGSRIRHTEAAELLAIGLRSLGVIEQRRGNYVTARRNFDEALAIARNANLEEEEGSILADTALLLSESGDSRSAVSNYERAITIARRHNDVANVQIWTGNMAGDLDSIGRSIDGERMAHEALALARDLGTRSEEARLLCILARITRRRGNIEGALQYQLSGYRIATETNNLFSQAKALEELANIQRDSGRLREAADAFDNSAALLYQIGRSNLAIHNAANACLVRTDLGEVKSALSRIQELVGASRTVGDDNLTSHCIGHLGHALRMMNLLPEAEAALNEAIDLASEDSDLLLNHLGNLAEVRQLAGDEIGAANTYAAVVSKSPLGHGRDRARGIALANLAGIALRKGSLSEARKLYKAALPALRAAKAGELIQIVAELNAIDASWT